MIEKIQNVLIKEIDNLFCILSSLLDPVFLWIYRSCQKNKIDMISCFAHIPPLYLDAYTYHTFVPDIKFGHVLLPEIII